MSPRILMFALVMAYSTNVVAENLIDSMRGTKEDAVVLVRRAVEYYKLNGEEKALADFSDPQGKFIDRDLYVFANAANGVCVAHGANKKLVGRPRIDEQDIDGKYYIKERTELMKDHESFWHYYKYPDPLT